MLVKEAKQLANISNGNSKMPGTTFAQDAFACHVGSRLAEVEGSVCSKCYARRIQKMRPTVNAGWRNNYERAVDLIANAPDKWVSACVFQIKRQADKTREYFHRWFDSGDLDSVEQLAAICEVARQTPDIAHWLPTREIAIVRAYSGDIPDNLVVRVSAPMIDQRPIKGFANTSTVHSKGQPHVGHECPAYKQGNNCGECRACWTKDVGNVSYPKH